MIEIDDFVMLGTTVPEPTTKCEAAVCSAGFSAQLGTGLMRIYPLSPKAIPRRWHTYKVPLERPSRQDDSRKESWKIAGPRAGARHWKVNEQFREMVKKRPPETFRDLLMPSVRLSIAEANERRESLAILFPQDMRVKLVPNQLSPDAPQLTLFDAKQRYEQLWGSKAYPWQPRIEFTDGAGRHSLQLRDWGVFLLMRKLGAGITSQDIVNALSLGEDSALLVGNLNNQRNAWIVISVLNGLKQRALFSIDEAPEKRHSARMGSRQRQLVAKVHGTTCYLCEFQVDLDCDTARPEGPTVEHIIPKEHGGDDSLENLRLVHRRCNESKGTRAS